MTEILCRRTIHGLAPEGESEAVAVLRHIPVGTLVVCDVKDPSRRSSAYHRWVFALLNKVHANQDFFQTVDHLRYALLARLGYVDRIVLRGGREVTVPKSMSFAKMSAEEFGRFAEAAIKFLCEEVIPGLEPNTLRREIEEMIGGPSVVIDAGGEPLTGLEGG